MSYEELKQRPEVVEALMRQARCERAEAVYRLVILPIKRLLAN